MASEAELLQKIKDLEAKLEEYDSTMSLFSEAERRMIRIIGKEMERLEQIVKVDTFNEEELEKFNVLAKDYVAIRGKAEKMIKEKNKNMSEEQIENLLYIVGQEVNE
jgi:hypothetical protein